MSRKRHLPSESSETSRPLRKKQKKNAGTTASEVYHGDASRYGSPEPVDWTDSEEEDDDDDEADFEISRSDPAKKKGSGRTAAVSAAKTRGAKKNEVCLQTVNILW